MKVVSILMLAFFCSLSTYSQTCLAGDCSNGYGVVELPDNSIRHGFFYNKGTGIGIDISESKIGMLYSVYEENRVAKVSRFSISVTKKGMIYILHPDNKGFQLDLEKGICNLIKLDENYNIVDLGTLKKNNTNKNCTYGNCDNGIGILTYSKGEFYVGEFNNSKREGLGFNFWQSKQIYYGEFLNDKMNGYGIYDWNLGQNKVSNYVGEWKNGVMEGKGVYYYGKNKFNAGIYENGKMKKVITSTDKK